MAGLYFHIPFCRTICGYCDFYRSADLRHIGEVLEAMERELLLRRQFIGAEPVRTIYFGGGTPSLCRPEWFGRILERCRELFDCSQLEEVTVEANPDDLNVEYLSALRRSGVDRLSMGVQSFDDGVLRFMRRRHDAAAAVAAVHAAREAGFGNITIDLIYGVPCGGSEALERSLDKALELSVEHVSAYHLTIEPATMFGRMASEGRLKAVDESVSEYEYALVDRRLTEAGYEHYEISNFARAGFRSRHNSSYWHSQHYLGIGPAAHSFDGRIRRWAVSSVAGYLKGVDDGSCYEEERLTDDDRYNETVMTSLRCIEGIGLSELEKSFGGARKEYLLQRAGRFLQQGLLARCGDRLSIPPRHWLISDSVIAELFV